MGGTQLGTFLAVACENAAPQIPRFQELKHTRDTPDLCRFFSPEITLSVTTFPPELLEKFKTWDP